jgi:hypothetical protein
VSGPRTEAGRALLDDLAYLRGNYAPMILAIEDEAAASGIVEQRLIQRIEAEAASEPSLRAALERLVRAANQPFMGHGLIDAIEQARAALTPEAPK